MNIPDFILIRRVVLPRMDWQANCDTHVAFLSWLRLGVYMAVVSTAIVLSFHLKRKPTDLERRMAIPFGVVFWVLSMACMISGLANYCRTVQQYSQRDALVQTGWKTEMVSSPLSAGNRKRVRTDEVVAGIHRRCYIYRGGVYFVYIYQCIYARLLTQTHMKS